VIPRLTNPAVAESDIWIRVKFWTLNSSTETIYAYAEVPWVFESSKPLVDGSTLTTDDTANCYLGNIINGNADFKNNRYTGTKTTEEYGWKVTPKFATTSLKLITADYLIWEWGDSVVSDTIEYEGAKTRIMLRQNMDKMMIT
jgi:hypothetical protein